MTIHHAIIRKAEKLGVILSEDKDTDTFTAHWPKLNVYAKGVGGFGKKAMEQMEAIIALHERLGPEFRIKNDGDDLFNIRVYNGDLSRTLDREPVVPTDALLVLDQMGDKEWPTTAVPTDGAQAHKEGWTAADNPFRDEDGEASDEEEESGMAEKWDEEFDAAADAAESAEEEEVSGSVVKPEYRARYAEQGHPNHCGDWLAETLNNLFLGKSKTDIEGFESLCNENGVDLSKYDRTNNGWQGRIRMTGRNLLARRIYIQRGILKVPAGVHPDGATTMTATPEWMSAQRFKMPKAEQNKKETVETAPAPAPVEDTSIADQQAEDAIEAANDHDNSEPEAAPSVQDQLAKHRASKNKRRK